MKNSCDCKKYIPLAEAVKALAHPTRLFIVYQLSERPHCVCELQEMIGADVSTVSKHLALLRRSGIVDSDKKGTKVIYRLKTPCVINFLGCMESVVREKAEETLALHNQR